MDEVDKKNRFDKEMFSYRVTKDGRVLLFWQGKQVKILKGSAAQKFLQDIINVDEKVMQLAMAKVTGNFKRGNERYKIMATILIFIDDCSRGDIRWQLVKSYYNV
jgi:hypothetical protein